MNSAVFSHVQRIAGFSDRREREREKGKFRNAFLLHGSYTKLGDRDIRVPFLFKDIENKRGGMGGIIFFVAKKD